MISKAKLKKSPSLVKLIQQSELTYIKLSIWLISAALILFLFGMYERHYKPKAKYFEVINQNELYPMRGLSYPNLNTRAVLRWAMEAATASYRFNFYDYSTSIKNLRPYFTELGYQNFVADLAKKVLPDVRQKKLVLTSVVTDTPVILKEGPIVDGNYAWEIQFPMLLTYESPPNYIYQKVVVTLFITQVPTIESPRGIGIASFITREGT